MQLLGLLVNLFLFLFGEVFQSLCHLVHLMLYEGQDIKDFGSLNFHVHLVSHKNVQPLLKRFHLRVPGCLLSLWWNHLWFDDGWWRLGCEHLILFMETLNFNIRVSIHVWLRSYWRWHQALSLLLRLLLGFLILIKLSLSFISLGDFIGHLVLQLVNLLKFLGITHWLHQDWRIIWFLSCGCLIDLLDASIQRRSNRWYLFDLVYDLLDSIFVGLEVIWFLVCGTDFFIHKWLRLFNSVITLNHSIVKTLLFLGAKGQIETTGAGGLLLGIFAGLLCCQWRLFLGVHDPQC